MRTSRLIALSGAALVATFGTASSAVAATTPPPAPAKAAASGNHGMGLDLNVAKARKAKLAKGVRAFGTAQTLRPAGIKSGEGDLSQYALTPGNQGNIGSCVTWATGYAGYGILMNQQKISGGPMAPMYIYSQVSRGNDRGTTASVALPMEQEQGIDTQSHYKHGPEDYVNQPTQEERQNAAKYKLSGFKEISTDAGTARPAIEAAINAGHPVPIGMQLRENFNDMDAQTAANYSYRPEGRTIGGHEITIIGYNSKGVKIQNSWGPSWGDRGFFTLSWDALFSGDLMEAHTMDGVQGGAPGPAPTDGPTDQPTDGPTDRPTDGPTDEPTDGPTDEPTDEPTDPSDDPEDGGDWWDDFFGAKK
ncbi:C1 family peptidase [Arsenicicoccus dermatophilus]|uniref:C1 family peptidase n=1 Tax=Arsenicicoccus dermatophilus TaxID=1076331 RepID=UPI0039173883